MKRVCLAIATASLLSCGLANAADMPVKARPLPPPVPVFSWTGFYIGAHVGGAWGTTEATLNSASFTECDFGVCEPAVVLSGFSIPISQTQIFSQRDPAVH